MKPTLPRGFRDFDPATQARRQRLIATITSVYAKYGYVQIETPAVENLDTLTGKYGDEGDQLMFKILNSGNYLENIDLSTENNKTLTPKIAEKALRYDLTIPFARFVAANRHNLTFPFRRYQVQPVWRADRPQKGRYREFWQFDADIVGTNSNLAEAELMAMAAEALSISGIGKFEIRVNHRAILAGLAQALNADGKEIDLCIAIDKWDKIGTDGVLIELQNRGFAIDMAQKAIETLEAIKMLPLSQAKGLIEQNLRFNQTLSDGFDHLNNIIETTILLQPQAKNYIIPDFTLARGLNYYTGAIFEIKSNEIEIGSIGGGGRYDNLTEQFDLPNVPGVGISLGIDRLMDVLLAIEPEMQQNFGAQVMVGRFSDNELEIALMVTNLLRENSIKTEMYLEPDKLKKQLATADKKGIKIMVICAPEEATRNAVNVKPLGLGQQFEITIDELVAKINSLLS